MDLTYVCKNGGERRLGLGERVTCVTSGRPKVCKQDRDDIIVKVNLQSPIPTYFYVTVAN